MVIQDDGQLIVLKPMAVEQNLFENSIVSENTNINSEVWKLDFPNCPPLLAKTARHHVIEYMFTLGPSPAGWDGREEGGVVGTVLVKHWRVVTNPAMLGTCDSEGATMSEYIFGQKYKEVLAKVTSATQLPQYTDERPHGDTPLVERIPICANLASNTLFSWFIVGKYTSKMLALGDTQGGADEIDCAFPSASFAPRINVPADRESPTGSFHHCYVEAEPHDFRVKTHDCTVVGLASSNVALIKAQRNGLTTIEQEKSVIMAYDVVPFLERFFKEDTVLRKQVGTQTKYLRDLVKLGAGLGSNNQLPNKVKPSNRLTAVFRMMGMASDAAMTYMNAMARLGFIDEKNDVQMKKFIEYRKKLAMDGTCDV